MYYQFTDKEKKNLVGAVKFLKLFSDSYKVEYVSDFREKIITEVRKKYSIDQFYLYEKIIGKIFWNLKNQIIKNINLIPNNKKKIYATVWPTSDMEIHNKCLHMGSFLGSNIIYGNDTGAKPKFEVKTNFEFIKIKKEKYRDSTTNFYLQYREKNNKIYKLLKPSYIDYLVMDILAKGKYNDIWNNVNKIKEFGPIYNLPYYYMNYGFPNINPMFYNDNSEKIWKKKIKLLYFYNSDKPISKKLYSYNVGKGPDKYWYKFINF